MGFLTFVFCTLFFAINASAVVVVNGVSQESQVGDTIAINANLTSGENFVNWKITYGNGKFGNEKIFNTTFIPSTDSVVIEYVTQKGSYKVLTDKETAYPYYENSISIPSNSYYGIATEYTPKEDGTYALLADVQRSIQYINYATDKTFTKQAQNLLQRKDANSKNVNMTPYTSVRYFNAQKDSTQYIFLRTTDLTNIPNEVYSIHVERTYDLNTAVDGKGSIEILETYRTMNLKGDSINIKAIAQTDNKFDHWKITSGNCLIQNTNQDSTYLIFKTTDCEVKAFFTEGKVYTITEKPVQYSTEKDFFAKKVSTGSTGVRFSFTAPADGNYTFVISNKTPNATITSTSYKSNDFLTSQTSKNFSGTYSETLTLTKGQAIGFTVNSQTNQNFWISYATQALSIKISPDANGVTTPASEYNPAYAGAKYFIGANANEGYRFSDWQIVSGNATIDEKSSPFTFITINSNTEIKANYKKNQIQTLTTTKTKFNYQKHYYNEASLSTIRFKLSIPDTNTNVIQIKSIDSKKAILTDYGNDSTFKNPVATYTIAKDSAFYIPKDSVQHIYWALKDNSDSIPNTTFYAWISKPYMLKVETTDEGSIYPNGEVKMLPYETGTITAWPYGGYTFNHWESIDGSFTINSPKNSHTKITLSDTLCIIKATFDFDSTVKPALKITNLDIGNLPGICAQVSVTDKKSGNTIFGLDTSDFILKQDGKALSTQTTTVQAITGISTVLVVDESTSMSIANRMTKAKESIRQFISEMKPYDRTAIVGFRGGDLTIVHQAMTSNKNLLFQATDSLKAIGGNTNINTGAYVGIEQVVGEINPTAVIVFSDGVNTGAQNRSINEVIDFSKKQKTTIYTIALENTNEIPLKTFADSTGGSFTIASDASELAGIYASIRDNVQSQYLVCYQNPDTLLNNETHDVTIQVNFAGKTALGLSQWQEGLLPPSIKLTDSTISKIQESQSANKDIKISAYVKATSKLSSVKIYFRTTSETGTSFQTESMQLVKDSLWEFTIPATSAVQPGIDFYIMATDSVGSIGKSPNIPAPSKEPYTIFIGNDIPKIAENPSICDSISGKKTFSFKISDKDSISTAKLFYKNLDAVIFTEVTLTHDTQKNVWTASVPADSKYFVQLNYYIRATDTKGATARSPVQDYLTTNSCEVKNPITILPDTIQIVNGDNANEVVHRSTSKVNLVIFGNGIMEGVDTLKANLSCKVSKDIVENITLVENSNGFYETLKSIPKDEGEPQKDDGIISCTGLDTLVATFTNPLSGLTATQILPINKYVAVTYQFLKEKKDEDLDSVETTKQAKFRLRITATSNNAYKIDTLSAFLFTEKGDSLKNIKVIETENNSAIFDYTGTFYFVDDSVNLKSSRLDATLNLDSTWNRVKIQARIDSDSSAQKKIDSLIVYNNYIPADIAEILDKDLDGKADFVRIHFMKKLKKNIASIDSVYWNKGGDTLRTVEKKKIKINSKDSHWVEASLKKPFSYGVTRIESTDLPYMRFTKTSSDFSQKIILKDKIGAVPVFAKKYPGAIDIDDYLSPTSKLPPDTLIIKMSEPIKNIGESDAWKDLFRYSESCDSSSSFPLKIKGTPKTDSLGLNWTIILADYRILKGYCITTNPETAYEDLEGNSLGRGGVELDGNDGNIYLQNVKPVRSISGFTDKAEWIPPDGDEWEELPDSISAIRVESTLPYTANIYIFDGVSTLVTNFKQKFGNKDEMTNPIRGNSLNHSKIGFLTWDQRSDNGRKVGTGVYIWKIIFKFDNGYKETRTLKTGILRRNE